MFLIMEVGVGFSFQAKASADQGNPKVQEREQLMWKFQQALPDAKPGEKWIQMERNLQAGEATATLTVTTITMTV